MGKLRNTWTGRTLARNVPCIKCQSTIEAGQLGFKRRHLQNLPDWICEACLPK
jgi:hypothetical protein